MLAIPAEPPTNSKPVVLNRFGSAAVMPAKSFEVLGFCEHDENILRCKPIVSTSAHDHFTTGLTYGQNEQ